MYGEQGEVHVSLIVNICVPGFFNPALLSGSMERRNPEREEKTKSK